MKNERLVLPTKRRRPVRTGQSRSLPTSQCRIWVVGPRDALFFSRAKSGRSIICDRTIRDRIFQGPWERKRVQHGI